MKNDPIFNEFLKIFNEEVDIHGGSKKKTLKGLYGGGNEYYQLEPDTELENMRERVLGSGLDKLDSTPGSMTVNPNSFEEYESELHGDLEGEKIAPFKYSPPKGFDKIDKTLPKVKSEPGKSKEGKELGETKRKIDDSLLIDNSVDVDDSEGDGRARDNSEPLSFAPQVNQISDPGSLTICPLSESEFDQKIEKSIDAVINEG